MFVIKQLIKHFTSGKIQLLINTFVNQELEIINLHQLETIMKKFYLLSILLLLTLLFIGQEKEKVTWQTRWNNGAEIKSSDGKFKFKFGGRIQFDVMNIYQNTSLSDEFEAQNGAEFRRLRWYTSGTIFGNIKFKLQFDFAKGDAGVKDAYIEVTKIPWVGNLKIGHFKQPFGFEMQTSSKYILFMERSLTHTFTPERDLGFMLHNRHFKKRFAWNVGYFYPSGSVGKYLGDQYRLTARVTGLPVYKKDERYVVLHIGAAYEYQMHNREEFRFSQRPEAHLAPRYVDLKIDAVDRADVFGGEMSFTYEQFSVQGEIMLARVNPSTGSVALGSVYNYFAYYGSFSWFITGEHRNYSQSKAAYNRINPKKNLGKKGAGAWELVIRLSHVDLNDKDLNGGAMTDITGGINWYLNPATRVMINYIHSDVLTKGNANIAMVRFQVAF